MEPAQDLSAYLDRLVELPFVRSVRAIHVGARGKVPTLVLTTPTGPRRLPFQQRRSHLTREVAEALALRGGAPPGLVVFAPTIGRELGELFASAGVNFVDLAGNCFLQLGDQYLARIQGQRAVTSSTPSDKGLRAPSYATLLALLIDPSLLDASVRALAVAAGGVSPQTAADLRARLVDQGLVHLARGHHRWAPEGWQQAFELWLAGWSTTLLPRLLLGRFRAREKDPEALEGRLSTALAEGPRWAWGGGAASKRLTGFYRGDRTVLYLDAPPIDLAKRLVLVPDREGPVHLVRAPGPLAFRSLHAQTVHPVLVYADLLEEGHPRAREAAHELRDRVLKGLEVA